MPPIQCRIPYSYDAHGTLYRMCLSVFMRLGEQAERDNYMETDRLREWSARADSAIRVMRWISWLDARERTIEADADADEVIRAFNHLEQAARERLAELLKDGSVRGSQEEIEGRGEIRVIAAPEEHLYEVTHLIDVTNVCGKLRRLTEKQREEV
jgi:hypothetical protein